MCMSKVKKDFTLLSLKDTFNFQNIQLRKKKENF